MGKMTFVVDFPDGREPAVSAATDILGGKLISANFSDLREQWTWRSASDTPAPEGEYVAVSDGECCYVGRFVSGEWRASGGRSFLSPVVHWMPLPEIDDSEGCQNVR